MNENKQVQVIVGCLFSTQDVYNVSGLEFVHIRRLSAVIPNLSGAVENKVYFPHGKQR